MKGGSTNGRKRQQQTDIFSVYLAETAASAEEAKLIMYLQHTEESYLKQDIIMQICKSHTTTSPEDMFCADTHSHKHNLRRDHLVAFCTGRDASNVRKQRASVADGGWRLPTVRQCFTAWNVDNS